MKKILLGILISVGGAAFAQSYPDYYPSSDNYANGYYSGSEDPYYFPDDYYYEYPSDYYSNDFYRSYYNDYQNSIRDINWNLFFSQYRLSPRQIQDIIYLNQRFPSFASWNSYYHLNPDRWYYDRFYALQQILGPQVFIVFQNVYYNGYSPIAYYTDYRLRHYRPVVYVMPRYRNININLFRIDRRQYHQNNGWNYRPAQKGGFRDTPRVGGNGNNVSPNNNGFRNNTSGLRSESTKTKQNNLPSDNAPGTRTNPAAGGGFRSQEPRTNPGSNGGTRTKERSVQPQNSEGKPAQNTSRAAGARLVNR